jgi:[CysO sulfur-carrier protein]-S-L-cysteine hydrolase
MASCASRARRSPRSRATCGIIAGPATDGALCDRVIPIENMAKALHKLDPKTYFRTPKTFFAFKERTLEAHITDGMYSGSPVPTSTSAPT